VGHVSFQFEVGEVGHVVEGHLLDVKSELTFGGDISERTVAQSFSFLDLQLAEVALLFQELLGLEAHSMWVLVLIISAQFIGVKTVVFSES
jgi:hypothetical protein